LEYQASYYDDIMVVNPSSAGYNGWVYEGENKVIDAPERITPDAIFNKLNL
jgi:hypothetical protein